MSPRWSFNLRNGEYLRDFPVEPGVDGLSLQCCYCFLSHFLIGLVEVPGLF